MHLKQTTSGHIMLQLIRTCNYGTRDAFSLMNIYYIIIILVITFMQSIYNYIPETNNASRVYSVAAVLYIHYLCYM